MRKAILVRDWNCATCGAKVWIDGKTALVCKCGTFKTIIDKETLANFHIEVIN